MSTEYTPFQPSLDTSPAAPALRRLLNDCLAAPTSAAGLPHQATVRASVDAAIRSMVRAGVDECDARFLAESLTAVFRLGSAGMALRRVRAAGLAQIIG